MREKFWAGLFEALAKFARELIPRKEIEESVVLDFHLQLKVPAKHWRPEGRGDLMKSVADGFSTLGEVTQFAMTTPQATLPAARGVCAVCGWTHDPECMEIRVHGYEPISLAGVLPDIVRCVHAAHEMGSVRLSTKDDELLKRCGGYLHPSKAFYDLGQREAYRTLFDTSRRGFIALRGFRAKT